MAVDDAESPMIERLAACMASSRSEARDDVRADRDFGPPFPWPRHKAHRVGARWRRFIAWDHVVAVLQREWRWASRALRSEQLEQLVVDFTPSSDDMRRRPISGRRRAPARHQQPRDGLPDRSWPH